MRTKFPAPEEFLLQFICWVIFYMKCLPAHMKWARGEYVVVVGGFTTDHCDPARSWLDSPCVFFEERDLFVLLYLESILREHWSSFSAPDSQTCRNKKVEVCFTVCRRLSIRQIVLSTVCGNSLLEFGCRVVSEVVYSFFTVWQLVMRLKNHYKSNTRLHIFHHHSPAP